MSSILHIDGNEYHPATVAAKQLGYTKEYLLMLAKQDKIDGRKVGNKWYVHIPSARKYFDVAEITQEDRRKAISSERKRELKEHTFSRVVHEAQLRKINNGRMAVAETLVILVIGLVVGTTGYLGTSTSQDASISSASDFVDTLALSLYRFVVPASDMPSGINSDELVDATWSGTEPEFHDTESGTIAVSPEKAIEDSFSDIVRVAFDPENPLVTVVTPLFKSGEGDSHRFLLVPVEDATP